MQEAVADPSTHQYPSNRGRAEFREAVARLLRAALRRRRSTPTTEVMPGDRRQGVHLQPQPRLPRSRRRRARRRPRLPGLHRRPAARRRRAGADAAACPSAASRPTSTRSPRDGARAREADVPQLPEQPDRRGRARRASSSGSSSSRASTTSSSSTTTPTRETTYDGYRRAVVPRDAGRQGGRRRGLLAVQGLQHDRLALRGDRRQRRRRSTTYWRLKTNIDSGLFEAVQLAGVAALSPDADAEVASMNELYRAPPRPRVSTRCATIGVDVTPPQGHDLRLGAGARRASTTSAAYCEHVLEEAARRDLARRRLRPQRRGLLPHLADDARRPAPRGGRADPPPWRRERRSRPAGAASMRTGRRSVLRPRD